MAELPTFAELYDAGKAEVQSRNTALTDFNDGSVLDAYTGAGAMLSDEVALVLVDLFAALFFDTAVGEQLDTLALDRLDLTRKPATGSRGTVQWSRGSSTDAYTIPSNTQFQATVGDESVIFTSATDVVLGAIETVVDVPVDATATGRGTNVAQATVTQILTPVGADSDATCINAQPMAGGAPRESDESFRSYIKRFYGTLRRGTVEALETGALGVPGVKFATVDEDRVESAGIVDVFIGDPDARSNDALAAAVATELELWRATGVMVEVSGATREEVALTLSVRVVRGADADAVSAAVRAAVVGYGDTLDPGQTAYVSRITQAAHQSSDLVIGVNATSHTSGTITPTSTNAAIRFTTDTISLQLQGG